MRRFLRPRITRRRLWFLKALALTALVLAGPTGRACAQVGLSFPIPVPGMQARQVTLFGVIATPDGESDPKLKQVQPQLAKLLPGHGFRLLGVRSKRLTAGETLACPLGDGFTATTTLLRPTDENGKVQLRASIYQDQSPPLETLVTTPANQLFYCDKVLPDGSRLLIGIGAR